MTRVSIGCGVLLIALGVGGHFGMAQDRWIGWISAALGLLILLLGLVALNERLRTNAVHAAVVAGLLGFVGTANALVRLGQKVLEEPGLVVQAIMALVCGGFVVLSIKSLWNMQSRRSESTSPQTTAEPSGNQPGAERPSEQNPLVSD